MSGAYTDAGLPLNGITPLSRHTSRQGAEDGAKRAYSQVVRYMALLKEHCGLTDFEAAALMRIERSSVNARRVPLVKAGLVGPNGTRPGPTGKLKNVVWSLR